MKFVVSILAVIALCTCAYAQDGQVFARQGDALEISALERSVPRTVKESFEIRRDISFDDGLKTLAKRFLDEIGGVFRIGLKSAAAIVAIGALCAVAASVNSAGGGAQRMGFITAAGALGICAACTGSVSTIVSMGKDAVEEINIFSHTLLPSLSAAAAASGAPLSASAKYMACALFGDVFVTVVGNLFFPMVYAYIALSTVDAAIEASPLGKIAALLKWLISWALKLSLTAFVTYLSISGLLASAGDSVAAKGARLAIGSVVPVVGGVIADAAETVIAGAAVMKNAIGIFGMLTVLSICLTPFITIGVNYFVFKAAAAVISPMVDARLGRLVDNIGAGFGLVLGMCASCALVMFVSVFSTMHITGAV